MFLTLLLTVAAPAPESPKYIAGKGFVAAPVATDLQRHVLTRGGSEKLEPTAVLVLNLYDLAGEENTLRTDTVDWPKAEEAAAAFRRGPGSGLIVWTIVSARPGPNNLHTLTHQLCAGLGQRAGYSKVAVRGTGGLSPPDWEGYLKGFRSAPAPAPEPPATNEAVTAYPVRTPLSRLLVGPDIAAYILVKTPLDLEASEWPADALRTSLANAVSRTGVTEGRAYVVPTYVGRSTEESRKRVGPFFEQLVRASGLSLKTITY